MIRQETVLLRGIPVDRDAVQVNGTTFIISGRGLRTARLKREWEDDVDDPDAVIRALKAAPGRVDLLQFWQRIPESEAKFSFPKQQRDIAVIPIRDYEHWWSKQISAKTRNMVRKSQKAGVTMQETALTDDLIRGIMGIFNESPIRRGKPFWHYGKDFETVKKEMSADLPNSIFIAARHAGELIGYTKLLVTDRYAIIVMLLDRMAQRDKAPMNGMIAKAVEVCAAQNISYLVYTAWRRGDHGQFQERNGFERFPVPEYFVPLTLRGQFALKLGLERGIKGAIPEKAMVWLLGARAKYYSWKYRQQAA
jgi:hypothetical protein